MSTDSLKGYQYLLELLSYMTGEVNYYEVSDVISPLELRKEGEEVKCGELFYNKLSLLLSSVNVSSSFYSLLHFSPNEVDIKAIREKKFLLNYSIKKFFEKKFEENGYLSDNLLNNNLLNLIFNSSTSSFLSSFPSSSSYINSDYILGMVGLGELNEREANTSIKNRLRRLISYLYKENILQKNCQLIKLSYSLYNNQNNEVLLPIWPLIFSCLRCGRYELAIEELELFLYNNVDFSTNSSSYVTSSSTSYGLNYLNSTSSSGIKEILLLLKVFIKLRDYFFDLNNLDENNVSSVNSSFTSILSSINLDEINQALSTLKEIYKHTTDEYHLKIINLFTFYDLNILFHKSNYGSINFKLEDILWSHNWCEEYSSVMKYLNSFLFENQINNQETKRFQYLSAISHIQELNYNNEELLKLVYSPSSTSCQLITSGWRSALVLACSNRFGEALLHLWLNRERFCASHLTLLYLNYGLILPHIPLNTSSSSPSNSLVPYSNATFPSYSTSLQLTPASLISQFILNDWFNCNPHFGLDYLMVLQIDWSSSINIDGLPTNSPQYYFFMKEKLKSNNLILNIIEKFILYHASNPLKRKLLIGEEIEVKNKTSSSISSSGAVSTSSSTITAPTQVSSSRSSNNYSSHNYCRSIGHIDSYFDESLINSLLIRLGNSLINLTSSTTSSSTSYITSSTSNIELSIEFFLLSNNYQRILEIFNNTLLNYFNFNNTIYFNKEFLLNSYQFSLFNIEILNEKNSLRTYWIEKSLSFIKKYLQGYDGNNHFFLNKQLNNTKDIEFLLLLISLHSFLNLFIYEKNYENALRLLDTLKIFPSFYDKNTSISLKFFDENVIKILDPLLLFTLELLRLYYLQLKEEINSTSSVTFSLSSATSSKINNANEKINLIKNFIKNLKSFFYDNNNSNNFHFSYDVRNILIGLETIFV